MRAGTFPTIPGDTKQKYEVEVILYPSLKAPLCWICPLRLLCPTSLLSPFPCVSSRTAIP
uniref:Uncharacterized protein n=1 Tax=Utricularia reniformis TaxID=192314 RepID=A0A1Y0B489_9LAMI|nr:hypothetical protein AEK19_MT2124 [Utricularia reniformis]ART32276.1 hypothetical protein AEK19_MT2124 [Utricularia reniformis]